MADKNPHRSGERIIFSWSGGKDSALALSRLIADRRCSVVGLVTTVTAGCDRTAIHGVRRILLQQQAAVLDLPLVEIMIAPESSNEQYESAWAATLRTLPPAMADATCVAFGDIHLEDVRSYREALLRSVGFASRFPLWGEPTAELAGEVLSSGIVARVLCVDTTLLDPAFSGRSYDATFLNGLPEDVDPCGERGEFHTFVSMAPGFRTPVRYEIGEVVLREDRFACCDLTPAGAD